MSGTPGASGASGPSADRPVVDWARTGRRLTIGLAVVAVVVVATWLVAGVVGDGLRPRLLAELAGLGLLVSFLVEVVVVGGAAARGLVRAGDRGERLSGTDVSLLPPQILRRRR